MEVLDAWAPQQAIGWTVLACGAGTQTALGCAGRAAVHRARRRAAVRRPLSTLVVGQGAQARQVTAALYDHPAYGLRPVGLVVAPGEADKDRAAGAVPLPVLVSPQEVGRAVVQNSVRHAVFTAPPEATPDGPALLSLLSGHGCRAWLVTGPGTTASAPADARPDHLWGFTVRPLSDGTDRPVGHAVKRAVDAVLAAFGLLLAAPVMAACALAVRLADGPGVIFRQERVGLTRPHLRPPEVPHAAARRRPGVGHPVERLLRRADEPGRQGAAADLPRRAAAAVERPARRHEHGRPPTRTPLLRSAVQPRPPRLPGPPPDARGHHGTGPGQRIAGGTPRSRSGPASTTTTSRPGRCGRTRACSRGRRAPCSASEAADHGGRPHPAHRPGAGFPERSPARGGAGGGSAGRCCPSSPPSCSLLPCRTGPRAGAVRPTWRRASRCSCAGGGCCICAAVR